MAAWSAAWALGKSWAVTTVMGSPLRCRDRRVASVTLARSTDGGAPMGECELCRACRAAAGKGRASGAARLGRGPRGGRSARASRGHGLATGAGAKAMAVVRG